MAIRVTLRPDDVLRLLRAGEIVVSDAWDKYGNADAKVVLKATAQPHLVDAVLAFSAPNHETEPSPFQGWILSDPDFLTVVGSTAWCTYVATNADRIWSDSVGRQPKEGDSLKGFRTLDSRPNLELEQIFSRWVAENYTPFVVKVTVNLP